MILDAVFALLCLGAAWAILRFPCEPSEAPLNLAWMGAFLMGSVNNASHLMMWPLGVIVLMAGSLGWCFFAFMIGWHGWRLRRVLPVMRKRVVPAAHPEALP